MNIIFEEIKQFIVKQVDTIEWLDNETDRFGVPMNIYVDKLEIGKKYLIVEIDEQNIIKINYPGAFKSISIDEDDGVIFKFDDCNYHNDYWNSSNLIKLNEKFGQLTEKIYCNIENAKINLNSKLKSGSELKSDPNLESDSNLNSNSDSDSLTMSDMIDLTSNFLFYELEQEFDIDKLIEIIQFYIDNHFDTQDNSYNKKILCVSKYKKVGLIMYETRKFKKNKKKIKRCKEIKKYISNLSDKTNFEIYI
jgi:hypothetical protein